MMKNDKPSYSHRGREGRLLGDGKRGRCKEQTEEEDEKDEEKGGYGDLRKDNRGRG